jgi:hypothetical protein
MRTLLLLALLAGKFWEEKDPADWSAEEMDAFFRSSPWVREASDSGRTLGTGGKPVAAFLATAEPVRAAEGERRRRTVRRGTSDGMFEEYLNYLLQNGKNVVILAVPVERNNAFSEGGELATMEKRSEMRAGGKAYPLLTFFPPSSSDPHLRLAFARPPNPGKKLDFTFYVPGLPSPYRMVDFQVKDLVWKGAPSF